MAFVVEDIKLNGLRKAHINQLYSYVKAREVEQWYSGNKAQFEKRHEELKQWLAEVVALVNQPDARLPK